MIGLIEGSACMYASELLRGRLAFTCIVGHQGYEKNDVARN